MSRGWKIGTTGFVIVVALCLIVVWRVGAPTKLAVSSTSLWLALTRHASSEKEETQISVCLDGWKPSGGIDIFLTEYRNTSEKELGLQIYPGATHDGRVKHYRSIGEDDVSISYRFATTDSPEEVLAFYKPKLRPGPDDECEVRKDKREMSVTIGATSSRNERVLLRAYAPAGRPTTITIVRYPRQQ